MFHNRHWIALALAAAGLQLCGCHNAQISHAKIEPAKFEKIESTGLNRLTLTERAVERLAIQTAPLREAEVSRAGNASQRKVVPYSAVIYDPKGEAWTYVMSEPRVFIRHAINIDYIEGDLAILSDGPPSGTQVVTVGAAELLGTEFKVGH